LNEVKNQKDSKTKILEGMDEETMKMKETIKN